MPEQSVKSFTSLWPTTPSRPFQTLSPKSSTITATQKVLTTYELLEPILLHIPFNQLLTSQRVSKTWHTLITRSIHIQEKLFFSSPHKPIKPIKPIHRESLHGAYRVLYRAKNFQLCPATPAVEPRPQAFTYGMYNHPVPPLPRQYRRPSALARWNLTDSGDILHFSIGMGGLLDRNFPPEEEIASWKNMHIASPPLEAVDLDFLPDVPEYSYTLTIWNPKGVRLGELYDWTFRLGRLFEKSGGFRLTERITVASFWVYASE
ncbi:hypothetical protein CKM354_001174600 [Cercospora kikuchii]|uniref:F-box domain-containing protein n=1 Tax=Cercospora kikuchii TaxID=84275 RepID=A0A9P3CU87_9PEZI|nr:uncharacterized protein CKM354_001174600 [Cercospora kikuchii]GIZ48696.1 hypothetical protein CKM354_001174600 [Cercospora kikuchii]